MDVLHNRLGCVFR